VELRFADGRIREIPFLQLPISQLPGDFFPLTCRSCVDYTNVLADITVGYMAGEGDQWLPVRNARGAELLALLGDEVVTSASGSAGKRAGAVRGFLANTERAAGGLPLRRMPNFLRGIVGWLMPRIGPRGLEFARARRDEGGRNRAASAPAASGAAEAHGAAAHLGTGRPLWRAVPGGRDRGGRDRPADQATVGGICGPGGLMLGISGYWPGYGRSGPGFGSAGGRSGGGSGEDWVMPD